MPGAYLIDVSVNDQYFGRRTIRFVSDDSGSSLPCLPEALVKEFGLKAAVLASLPRSGDGGCVRLDAFEGVTIRYVQNIAVLRITIPQVAFEYDDPDYIPSERWSNGIGGALLDYHVIGSTTRQFGNGYTNPQSSSLQTYGTVGANFGAWRLRGDYQGWLNSGGGFGGDRDFRFNRLYAYRAIPSLRSMVSFGHNYLSSDIFDTFALTGITAQSDDRMLPPSLRGYAPLITGVARSNATVTVSQQGRVLYATRVSSGAFALQDISANVQGTLDVTVREEDGSEQHFTVTSAAVPFLARQGQIRYKLAAGKPRLFGGAGITPLFGFAEAAYGLPMDFTLYGGAIGTSGYASFAAGIGKDLGRLGAVSADVTTARATLWWNGQQRSGQSYRFNYSKHFDSLDTDLRFVGYRFSERTYTTFPQFTGDPNAQRFASSRQRFSLTLAKRLFDVSAYLSYDHASYWSKQSDDRVGISLARPLSIGSLKNINMNVSAFRTQGGSGTNNQVFTSLTVPLGNRRHASANVSSSTSGGLNINAGINGDTGQGLSYSVYGGASDGRPSFSADVRRTTSFYQINAQAAAVANTYVAASLELDGSFVATRHGVTPHANGNNGDTRLLVSTDGVAGIPLTGYEAVTNRWGYAVIGAVSPFDVFDASVNAEKLPIDANVTNPTQRLVLTEGAIGYIHFDTVRGRNLLIALNTNGRAVPFGASVVDLHTGREVGIVGERGVTYLVDAQSDGELVAQSGGRTLCRIGSLPDAMPTDGIAIPATCSPAMYAGGDKSRS